MAKQQKGNQKGAPNPQTSQFLMKRLTEGGFILILTVAIFVFLSLITYKTNDPGLFHGEGQSPDIANAGGQVGANLSDALYSSFGFVAYLLPVCLVLIAWLILKDFRALSRLNPLALLLRTVGLLLFVVGGCGLLALEFQQPAVGVTRSGGVIGESIAVFLSHALNVQGSSLVLLAMLLVGVTWSTGLSWIKTVECLGAGMLALSRLVFKLIRLLGQRMYGVSLQIAARLNAWNRDRSVRIAPPEHKKIKSLQKKRLFKAKPDSEASQSEPPIQAAPPRPKKTVSGILPPLNLLEKGQPGKPMGGYSHQELETLSREVEQHLLDFGIQADVVSVHPGPVITRFELQLAAGIKVSKLTALAKDLARSLSVSSVRVVEIIPGKTVVGIELPNQNRATVSLSEVLSAEVYQRAQSPLTLALGVDISGDPMVVDLAKMPHLLVAGTTGSGKSVGMNAMILSLLFKASPEQVRLIMIDPKMLELSVYDGIPHLLTPVVTDMKEAASALRWCVAEMERRYRLMAALGVRNLAGFNARIIDSAARKEPVLDPLWKAGQSEEEQAPELQTLPYVVVMIDELADMMMVVGKKVEQLIARIAQKARAAGIHLILATQRPSVDVLTGLIKSNIPTRISFQVSSKIDSRTILDQQGAEQLLGHGDMLFLSPGAGTPLRVHGAFVADKEVHQVADDWRARGAPEYIEAITQSFGEGLEAGFDDEEQATEEADALYDQAVEFIIKTRKASISAVQRRFKIGYNRAARLVEEMERTGVVGPLEGGVRDVLVSTVNED